MSEHARRLFCQRRFPRESFGVQLENRLDGKIERMHAHGFPGTAKEDAVESVCRWVSVCLRSTMAGKTQKKNHACGCVTQTLYEQKQKRLCFSAGVIADFITNSVRVVTGICLHKDRVSVCMCVGVSERDSRGERQRGMNGSG